MIQKHKSFEMAAGFTALTIAAGVGAAAARAAVHAPVRITSIGRQIERHELTPEPHATATLEITAPEQDGAASIHSTSENIDDLNKVKIAIDNKHQKPLLSLTFSKKPDGEWSVVKRVDGVKQKPDQTNLEQSATQAKSVLNYLLNGKNVPNSVLYEKKKVVPQKPSSTSTAPPQNNTPGSTPQPNVPPLAITGAPGPNTAPTTQPEAPTAPITLSADPEVLNSAVTSTTANTLVKYTAYNSTLGCSGRVLYNQNAFPVGEITCDHGGELTIQDNLATDSEGQQYYNLSNPLTVDIGSEAGDPDAAPGESTEIGIGNAAMVLPNGTNDELVISFEGQNISDVFKLAQAVTVPNPQDLAPGTIVVESGKPATTDGSTAQTQNFPMTVIGSVNNWTMSENGNTLENLSVTLAIMPATANQKGCTPGISGAGAFLLTGPNSSNTREIATNDAGEPMMIGTANSYDVLSSTITTGTTLSWLQGNFPNVDFSDYVKYINAGNTAYLCAIANQLPDPSQAETIPIGNPEYPSISSLAEQFRDDLLQPGYTPQIFNGILNFGSTWLERPAYYVDTATNTLLLASYEPSATSDDNQVADHVDIMVFSNASQYITSMSGYSLDGVTAPGVTTVEGPLSLSADDSELEDGSGSIDGQVIQSATANTAGATFSIDSNGNIVVNQPAGGIIPTVTITGSSSP